MKMEGKRTRSAARGRSWIHRGLGRRDRATGPWMLIGESGETKARRGALPDSYLARVGSQSEAEAQGSAPRLARYD